MAVRHRTYDPERDFLRIRDMLSDTCQFRGKPFNWDIARWNYARYFVAPLFGAYGLVNIPPDAIQDKCREAIGFWERSISVWENESGTIIGVVNPEQHTPRYPANGQVFIQRHPDYGWLLDEMIGHAEKAFTGREIKTLRLQIYGHDQELQEAVLRRGYQQDIEHPECEKEYLIEKMPESFLPAGYAFQSMVEDNDIEKRRKVVGLSFYHTDPAEWPSAYSYQELQKAPDYRKELDLYVVSPEGDYVSCCIVWYDARNRIAWLEPVGSVRLGCGREVVMEGIRRAAALGAKKVIGGQHRFYMAIGFQDGCSSYQWTKSFERGKL